MITDMETTLKPATPLKQWLLFRFAHPLGPTLLFGPIVLLLAGFSLNLQARSALTVVLSIAAGIFCWTLIEYVLHRFIFHLVQVKEPWKTISSGLHMAHHRDTELKELIIAPPTVSLVFSSVIFLSLWAITQDYKLALLLVAGVFIGYILYEWAHYAAHQYNSKNAVFKYLKRYHLQHHFKHPNGTYGVTTPMWDYVFGSSYRPKKI